MKALCHHGEAADATPVPCCGILLGFEMAVWPVHIPYQPTVCNKTLLWKGLVTEIHIAVRRIYNSLSVFEQNY
jgi:hypothetical protein